ncbi:hypothetical protein Tco_0502814 [Tanacetum coccineum]
MEAISDPSCPFKSSASSTGSSVSNLWISKPPINVRLLVDWLSDFYIVDYIGLDIAIMLSTTVSGRIIGHGKVGIPGLDYSTGLDFLDYNQGEENLPEITGHPPSAFLGPKCDSAQFADNGYDWNLRSNVESTEIDLTELQDDIHDENQEDGDIGGNGEAQPSGVDADVKSRLIVLYSCIENAEVDSNSCDAS